MRRHRYGGYRGRRTGRDILKYFILALLVVIAVLAGVLFLNRERPAQQEDPVQPEQSQPQTPEQPQPEPEPEPIPEPEPEPTFMAAVEADITRVADGSWKSWLEEQGANALVLNMKTDEGILNWESGKTVSDSAVNRALKQLNDGEIHTVARMACFRDEALANTYEYCIHSNSGYRWKDFGGVHWVSPAHTDVQDKLVAQAVELAELGFDEILLDHFGYPQAGSGEMGWIKKGPVYDPQHLDLVVGAFLTRVRQALEPYEITISLRTNAGVVHNDGDLTGVTGAVLEEFSDRVWLSEVDTDAPLAEILTLAGVSDVENRLVIQTAALHSGAGWAQAVLNF